MNLFLAWVIIGVCCYFIGYNRRVAKYGKFHLGKAFAVDINDTFNELVRNNNHSVIKGLQRANTLVEGATLLLSVILSPFALYYSVKRLFIKSDEQDVKWLAKVAEFEKKYGDLGL